MVKFNRELLKRLMAENKINGSELARRTGVTRSCVSKILNDPNRMPESRFLLTLNNIFAGYTMNDFILNEPSTFDNTEQAATREAV